MLKAFPKSAKLVWCQEEPQNMGAWTFIEPRLRTMLCSEIAYAGREPSASPAVGALARHKREEAALVAASFSVLLLGLYRRCAPYGSYSLHKLYWRCC